MNPEFGVKKLTSTAKIPTRGTAGASGLDLYADEPAYMFSCERKVVSCGIAVVLPFGYEGQIRPRSGMAAKHGITVLNSPGTIDSDYTGCVKVILYNSGGAPVSIAVGDRIAQLVIQKVEMFEPVEVDSLDETERGDGGFGSTGR